MKTEEEKKEICLLLVTRRTARRIGSVSFRSGLCAGMLAATAMFSAVLALALHSLFLLAVAIFDIILLFLQHYGRAKWLQALDGLFVDGGESGETADGD